MADNLGWFGDDKQNIETIMQEKGLPVVWAAPDAAGLELLQQKVQKTRAQFEAEQRARQLKEAQEPEPESKDSKQA